jgi:hypothetical protein
MAVVLTLMNRFLLAFFLFLDHLFLPIHFLTERIFIWPAVVSFWFQPTLSWPWGITYKQLLHSLLTFFHCHYPTENGLHPLSLNEDDFDNFMEQAKSTHLLIPFDLATVGSFIHSFPPISQFITCLFTIPLLRWFVGPMVPQIENNKVVILIPKCRFLKEAKEEFGEQKGTEMCVKQCAIAMEHIFRERAKIEISFEPDLDSMSCCIRAECRARDQNGRKKRYLQRTTVE